MGGNAVTSEGLVELVKGLKGPAFRDVNFALREESGRIADEMLPHIALAVRLSPAPQARAMSETVRVKRDRVPVVSIGKVNPKFSGEKRFTRKGSNSARRRGAIAHGVVYGPKGGHRGTPTGQNFYRRTRDDSGGALGRSLRSGPIMHRAEAIYLKMFMRVLSDAGFTTQVR